MIGAKLRLARRRLNHFQQNHVVVGLPLAVLKKYGDDRANDYAGLITYYAFLSLFPLLLLLLTILELVMAGNGPLRAKILNALFDNFPLLSEELRHNVTILHGSGWRLLISAVFTLLGSLGVANALQMSLFDLWQIPKLRRPAFPENYLRSLALILLGGGGLLVVTLVGQYPGWPWWLTRPVALAVGFGFFMAGFLVATAGRIAARHLVVGAAMSTLAWQGLQSVGWLLLRREMHRLGALYGAFAVVLGLLSWIYLQARIMLYAVETDIVLARHLWPRSLTNHLTAADKTALAAYATNEKRHHRERIHVRFTRHRPNKTHNLEK